MPYNDMEESLRLLYAHLQTLHTSENFHANSLFASSPPPVTGSFGEAIESIQHIILDLSKALNKAIHRYLSLVPSTQQARVAKQATSIPWLPNEMMVKIFYSLVEDGSHNLGPLLFVDKRVHALVTSTSSLWCNISITIDRTFREANDLSAQCIQSCIGYSRSSPLDVTLDLRWTPDPKQCAENIVKCLRGTEQHSHTAITLARQAASAMSWRSDDRFYRLRKEELKKLVRAMIGPKGIHMRNWKAFRLSPPGDTELDVGKLIWKHFRYPAPNLETFIINSTISEDGIHFRSCFSDMTAVRHLVLQQEEALEVAPLSRHLLKTANITYDRNGSLLNILSDFSSLVELTITDISESDASEEMSIHLPSLKKFTLEGDIHDFDKVTFDTPCLEKCVLWCLYGSYVPKMQARSVIWYPKWFHDKSENEKLNMIMEIIERLLTRVKGMEDLVFDIWKGDEIRQSVQELVAQRTFDIPGDLRVIRFFQSGIERGTVYTNN